MDDLGWSQSQKGTVLSAFFWGYSLGQVPASRLAQIYGAKTTFGLAIFIPSILTLLVPWACRHSFEATLVIRVLIGLFLSNYLYINIYDYFYLTNYLSIYLSLYVYN
jgi:MFS family permease